MKSPDCADGPISPPALLPQPPTRPAPAELTWRLVRRNGRPSDVVAFEESVLAFFLESAVLLGVPQSLAAIYGVCVARPNPVSFSDVRECLNLSAGSVSQGLRALHEMGALKIVTPGGRRERFAPEMQLQKLLVRFFDQCLNKRIESGRRRLQVIADSLPNGDAESVRRLKDRLKAVQTWHDQTRAVLPLVKTFLKRRSGKYRMAT